MVTYEELRERLGSRPFQKFRIIYSGGQVLKVKRPNQVVAMKGRIYAGPGKNLPMWIWFDEIERMEMGEPKSA
jgi:hypothetical protein